MPKTLADICNEVCDECGWDRPASYASSTAQLGRQLFTLAKRTVENLAEDRDWPILNGVYAFPTVNGVATYALPANYAKLLVKTLFNTDNDSRLRGGVNAAEFARLAQGNLATSARYTYRLSDGLIELTPTPSTVDNLALYFKKNTPVTDNGGVPKAVLTADTDMFLLPEGLVQLGLLWRAKRAKGFAYDEEFAEFERRVPQVYAQQLALGDVGIGGCRLTDWPLTEGYVPENGYGS